MGSILYSSGKSYKPTPSILASHSGHFPSTNRLLLISPSVRCPFSLPPVLGSSVFGGKLRFVDPRWCLFSGSVFPKEAIETGSVDFRRPLRAGPWDYPGITSMTLFCVPKRFQHIRSLPGSVCHWPSTRNLYSYRPGKSKVVFFQAPSASFFMGCFLRFQLLKSPRKNRVFTVYLPS